MQHTVYRLYILSGFNLKTKKTKVLGSILLLNETFITYNEMFKNLKNKFAFNPKLFNIDFNKTSCKAIKLNFLLYISLYISFIMFKVYSK